MAKSYMVKNCLAKCCVCGHLLPLAGGEHVCESCSAAAANRQHAETMQRRALVEPSATSKRGARSNAGDMSEQAAAAVCDSVIHALDEAVEDLSVDEHVVVLEDLLRSLRERLVAARECLEESAGGE